MGSTSNPATGENALCVDFVPNAQGRPSSPVAIRSATLTLPTPAAGRVDAPAVGEGRSSECRDRQDFELTVEEGRRIFLQTRAGQRTPWPVVQIAVDFVRARLTDPATALQRLAPCNLQAIQCARLVSDSAPHE